MGVILPVLKIMNKGERAPVGYQQIPCHVVFDVKIDFTRKARFVAGGHVTAPPTTQTYASVVSRDSVRIAFLIAALNDLKLMAADVQGAYLNAKCHEKVYTVCGPEFGNETWMCCYHCKGIIRTKDKHIRMERASIANPKT
jgi:Reverse transcriptase (RNA-dependent DNA polymerase)